MPHVEWLGLYTSNLVPMSMLSTTLTTINPKLPCNIYYIKKSTKYIPSQSPEHLLILDIPASVVYLQVNILVIVQLECTLNMQILQASSLAYEHTVHQHFLCSVARGHEFHLLTISSLLPAPANGQCAVRSKLLLWVLESWFDQFLAHQ